jgi:thymidylate kinase
MNNTTDPTESLLNQCARCPAADQDVAWLLPLLRRIDQLRSERSRVLVAVEGGSASGKTTLAAMLTKIYDCNVFHMDDFFLQPHQRTAERLAEIGGNVDRERFLEEVLLPLTRGEAVHYRRYDCQTQAIGPAVEVPPKALNIVEGAYSMHPALADCYDLSAFLRISPELQHARIEKRNDPAAQERFFHTWIPLEERYFASTDTPGRCEMILEVEP